MVCLTCGRHLLSLVEPLTHDATFVRTQAPECVFLHPQTRVTSSAPVPGAALSAHTGESKAGQVWSTRVESVGISGNRVGGVERAGIAGKSGKSVGAGDSSTRMSSGGGICQPRASRAQSAAAVPGGALSPTIVGTTSGKVTADSEGMCIGCRAPMFLRGSNAAESGNYGQAKPKLQCGLMQERSGRERIRDLPSKAQILPSSLYDA